MQAFKLNRALPQHESSFFLMYYFGNVGISGDFLFDKDKAWVFSAGGSSTETSGVLQFGIQNEVKFGGSAV